jgi:ABC-type bacteriocin/lantibiotic exporter with double-glycine peptidase domain
LGHPDDGKDPVANDEDEKEIHGPKIELKDVWFQYPTRDAPVLCGVNMTVGPPKPLQIPRLTISRSRKASS